MEEDVCENIYLQRRVKGPRNKEATDQVTVMHCDANGNYKLKPVVIYHVPCTEGISQIFPLGLLVVYKEGLGVRSNIH